MISCRCEMLGKGEEPLRLQNFDTSTIIQRGGD
jgi:hypothetical protein